MKRIYIIIFIFIQAIVSYGQNSEFIVNDSSQYGFNRPRIALLNNDVPFVLWGKPGSPAKVWGAKLNGSSFTTPVQIVSDTMNPRVGTVDGPNLVAYNDSIYVVWGNQSPANHHVFMNRSTDAGNSFGYAIQTDTIGLGDNIEYPGLTISNNGTLGIYFIKSDPSWNNPRQSLITSYDRGNSFSKDTTINLFAPGIPCECCQGNMEMQDSTWVFYYRNNVGNIRNVYSLVSENSGTTFSDDYEMDDVDWTTMSCPSSGPEGYLHGNKSFTAWMSKGSGSTRVLYGTVNLALQTVNIAKYIDSTVAVNITQNYPSVDGQGDTIAVVWQDNRYLFTHVFAAISIDGGSTFTSAILLSDTSIISSYSVPDVAYSNGIFHFVWKSSNKVFYRSATLSNLLSIDNNEIKNVEFKIYPNPSTNLLTVETKLNILQINIVDITGKMINSFVPTSNTFSINSLSSGIYFIRIIGEDNLSTKKFVKQ